MYLTTTLSIMLVLLLVGLETIVVLGAHHLVSRVRENFTVTVVMKADADSLAVSRLNKVLEAVPYARSYNYISKQDALSEHIDALGEDPTRFLGYNPLPDSYELQLREQYANADSIAVVKQQLEQLPYVDDVLYEEDVVLALDHQLGSISVALLSVALLLLIVAWALIVNTIRLQVYAKRFLINTMRLVGATSWVIRAPFVRRSVLMGLEAAVAATAVLFAMLYYAKWRMGIVVVPLTWSNLAIIAAVILVSGIVITFFASLFATGRYVRMKIDKMYEI